MLSVDKVLNGSESINICFCIDENYVCQLGAVLGSIVESNAENAVSIYIISKNIKNISKKRLASVVDELDFFSIQFVESQDEDISNLKAGGHISSATYIRFEIPELLPRLDKVLYLDADLIVNDDLSELWETDLDNYYAAAVDNPFFDRYGSLGIHSSQGYFNAGVLLMNLSKWREDDVKNKALDFLRKNQDLAVMFDQDALNFVFKGAWKTLRLRWNLQTSFLRGRRKLPLFAMVIKEAYCNPGIVHYSSSSKPWDFLDPHPKSYMYRKHEKKFGKLRRNISFFSLFRSLAKWVYLKFVFLYQLL